MNKDLDSLIKEEKEKSRQEFIRRRRYVRVIIIGALAAIVLAGFVATFWLFQGLPARQFTLIGLTVLGVALLDGLVLLVNRLRGNPVSVRTLNAVIVVIGGLVTAVIMPVILGTE